MSRGWRWQRAERNMYYEVLLACCRLSASKRPQLLSLSLLQHGPTNLLLKIRIHRDRAVSPLVSYGIETDLQILLALQDTGNKVSRKAAIAGPQNIILGGKTIISSGAIIRGDLRRSGPGHAVVISLGRYCLVGEGCVLRCVYSDALGDLVAHTFMQATLQNISRRFQLLSDESRRPCSYRSELCG